MPNPDLLSVARGDTTADLVLRNARVVNVFSGDISETNIAVHDGFIVGLGDYRGHTEYDLGGRYAVPGFIDGHIHIESSLLLPHNFGWAVSAWGTTAVVADPHEIANVLGVEGIRLMRASAQLGPIDVFFMAPSCVPATTLETSGAVIDSAEIEGLLKEDWIIGLAEVMNFPGVVSGIPEVLDKIKAAAGKPVDGHAPGLTGKDLNAYVAAGVRSDHECTTAAEAYEKLATGMHIMIREGSTAKNLKALLPIVNSHNAARFMLVTDDTNPHDLLTGHLNHILAKAVRMGLDPITAVRMVTINPATYFGLSHLGAVAPGYQADITVLDCLTEFTPFMVFKSGKMVMEKGSPVKDQAWQNFPVMTQMNVVLPDNPFRIKALGTTVKVIDIIPDQLITRRADVKPKVENGQAVPDINHDILKIAVVERHTGSGNVGLGFVRGFGLKNGALASSVAHDSHNIVVVGTNDTDMEIAVREVIDMGGGQAVANGGYVTSALSLPMAGLMSDLGAPEVAGLVAELKRATGELGCKLAEPFMTMSFLSLPVIPELKITDRGLVDVNKFKFVSLFGRSSL